MNRKILSWISSLFLALGMASSSYAAEHAGTKVGGAEERMVQQAAQSYINDQVNKSGSFEIDDAKLNKKWKLKFDFFHTVNQLANGDYFFCADFTEGNDRLDLDFTLSGEDLKTQKVVIHKVNGQARE